MHDQKYLTKSEAADFLRLTPGTVAVLASQGRLPAIRMRGPKGACRKLLFQKSDLEKMMEDAKGL